jgi:hypothetical protein
MESATVERSKGRFVFVERKGKCEEKRQMAKMGKVMEKRENRVWQLWGYK